MAGKNLLRKATPALDSQAGCACLSPGERDLNGEKAQERRGRAGGASARPVLPAPQARGLFRRVQTGTDAPAGLTCHQTVILRMAVATSVYVNVPRGNSSQTSARDSSAFC